MHEPRGSGRTIGLLYLILAILGAFSLVYVPGKLIVPGDAAATAHRILASESLYRLSIVSGLISTVLFLYLARALYRLFRPVDEGQAAWLVVLVMVTVAIGLAITINDIAALVVLQSGDLLATFSAPQREALAALFLRLGAEGIPLVMIFWGLWLFPFGLLVIRSRFLPRILGVLLIANGVAYVVLTFIRLLLPELSDGADRIALVFELGEVWVILWLLIRGVRSPVPARADS